MLEPKPALPVVPAAVADQELNPPGPSPGADVALELVPMPVPWCWCARGCVHGCREHHLLPAELLPSEGGEPCGPLLWESPGPGQHDKVVKRSPRCLPAPGQGRVQASFLCFAGHLEPCRSRPSQEPICHPACAGTAAAAPSPPPRGRPGDEGRAFSWRQGRAVSQGLSLVPSLPQHLLW